MSRLVYDDEHDGLLKSTIVCYALVYLVLLIMLYQQLLLYCFEKKGRRTFHCLTLGGYLCCGECSLRTFRQRYYKRENLLGEDDEEIESA